MCDLPIGTILTVPKNVCMEGWITYKGYEDLNKYPTLKKVLNNAYLELISPILAGSIKFSLGNDKYDSWVNWNDVGSLSIYPELKCAIHELIEDMPLDDNRKIWQQAYDNDLLPDINSLFFRVDTVGGYFKKGSAGRALYYPVIEHTENLMRPIGLTATEEPKEVYNSVVSSSASITNIPANMVLLGQDPSIHRLKKSANLIQSGSDEYGFPTHMTVEVLINTRTYFANVPSTHKLIIKCK